MGALYENEKSIAAGTGCGQDCLCRSSCHDYWLWARNDWKDYYTTIQYVIDVFAFFYFVSRSIRVKKYKQEEPDEMSEANLKRCDAICLKIVVGLIVALGFVCAAGRFAISTEIIGYGLMGTLVLLAVIRTVLFCYMDKKGV